MTVLLVSRETSVHTVIYDKSETMPGWNTCKVITFNTLYMCLFFAVSGPTTTFQSDGSQLTEMYTSDGYKSAIIYTLAALLGVSVIINIILIVK